MIRGGFHLEVDAALAKAEFLVDVFQAGLQTEFP